MKSPRSCARASQGFPREIFREQSGHLRMFVHGIVAHTVLNAESQHRT